MKCKVCGKNYHCCSSCDTTGEDWLGSGYCSEKCFINSNLYKQEKGQLYAFLDRLDEGDIRLFKTILEMQDYLVIDEYDKWINEYLKQESK